MGLPGCAAYVNTFGQLHARARIAAEARPDLLQLFDLGHCTPGPDGISKPMIAFRLGRGDATAGTNAGAHPQEFATTNQHVDFLEAAVFGNDPVRAARLEQSNLSGFITMSPAWYDEAVRRPGDLVRLVDGTNLNRNAPSHTHAPGPEFGPHAASTPEMQALVDFHTTVSRPSIFLDGHSFGNAVFYPNHKPSEQMARQLAERTGVLPRLATDQDPVSGTISDFAAHTLGVPGVTWESGRTFGQHGAEYGQTRRQLFSVWDHMMALAPDPVRMLQAPTIGGVRIDAATGAVKARGQFPSAWIDDLAADAEIVTRHDAAPGSGFALNSSAAGARQSMIGANYTGRVSLSALDSAQDGLLWVRGQTTDGAWGPLEPIHLDRATKRR